MKRRLDGPKIMLKVINKAWGWIGLSATEVVATNAFGNLVVRATDGSYWRICPEELSCEKVAADDSAYQRLIGDPEFQADWQMDLLVSVAESKLGRNPPERCFCLKIPGVLGGAYDIKNVGTITRAELVAAAGDIAEQIKDVPNGGQIILKVGPKPA